MTTNRRERRAEARKAATIRSSKIAARALNKRRAARPDNKTEAEEINRMRTRRNFNVPDDPTLSQRALYAAKQYVDVSKLLFSQKSAPTYLAVVVHVVLCLAAILIIGWARQESHSTSSSSLALRDNTSLAIAAWDLMQLNV